MKKWIASLIICLLFAVQTPVAKANETAELKQQMAQQVKMLEQMQKRLEKLETEQTQQNQEIQKEIAKAVNEKEFSSVPDSLKWAQNIKWGGDFRYRYESIDDDTKATKRDRNRIRARLKLKAKINDEWDATFRLASGSSDSPTSTNQTLGSGDDSFSSHEIWLDQAYVNYHPTWKPGLNVLLGKMANPFYKVGKNQLIFDGDLSPEGGAVTYKWDVSDSTSAKLTGGAFWLSERSTEADTSIFGIQGLLRHDFSDGNHIVGGLSYYDFGNIQGKGLSGIHAKGNSQTGGLYDNDYDIFEGFAEYGFSLADRPAAIYGSYVNNIAASNSEDTAWLIGAKYNKAKKPGSWELSYNYREVDKDAVVGGLCDSDFVGGGTDGKGHVFGFKYQLAKNVQAGLHYFINEKNVSSTKDDFRMLQADLVYKF